MSQALIASGQDETRVSGETLCDPDETRISGETCADETRVTMRPGIT
jgi:hypothetical protein